MGAVPTIKVWWPGKFGYAWINESDFDPKIHQKWEEEKPKPKEKEKPKQRRKKVEAE
jgi:hypothetical protein